MSDFLAAAAAAVGGPEELVERSARARAAATGADYEAILQAWAGGGEAPAPSTVSGSAPAAAEEPSAPETQPPAEAPSEAPAEAPDPPAPSGVEAAADEGQDAPRVVEGPPPPATVSVEEAADWEVVTTVPAAGLKERTASLIPAWLMGFFVLIPLFAVAYIAVYSNGPECGSGGQLRVDFRNQLVNCDGSAYEGAGGPGGGGINYVAIGADVYANVAQCAGCHGSDGGGGSAGPTLLGVNGTFGSCADHQQWITLGSQGWIDTIGPNYGDANKPAGGFGAKMPGFASLTAEQLAAVTVYERVVFGGAGIDETLENCGLVETEEAPDEAPTDAETTPTTEPAS